MSDEQDEQQREAAPDAGTQAARAEKPAKVRKAGKAAKAEPPSQDAQSSTDEQSSLDEQSSGDGQASQDARPAPSDEVAQDERASADEQGEGAGLWPVDRLRPVLEAILFASGDPLPAKKVVEIVEGTTIEEVKATLADLSTDLLTRGIRLVEVAGGWQLRTAPEHQRYVRKLFRERPARLTRAATETVAIVAYKQPVTRMEIETVRGVDSGGVLESLIERRLVKVVGRKDLPGRPLVYGTTKEFLELFGLRSLRDMPTLPELGHDFERMSDQGGFNESDGARILPLEEDDAAAAGQQGTEQGASGSAAEPQEAGSDGDAGSQAAASGESEDGSFAGGAAARRKKAKAGARRGQEDDPGAAGRGEEENPGAAGRGEEENLGAAGHGQEEAGPGTAASADDEEGEEPER